MEAREAELIAAAMSLVDTPFVHQQRQPGVGMDCLGCMILPPNMVGLPFEDCRTYSRNPNPRQLVREVARRMDLVKLVSDPSRLLDGVRHTSALDSVPRFGDIGLAWLNPMRQGRPHHAFMLVPGPDGTSAWMVHAWMEAKRVTWNPYVAPWTETTHSFWRYRWQP